MFKKAVLFSVVAVMLVFCGSGVYAGVAPYSQYLIQDMSSSVMESSAGNLLINGNTFAFFPVDEIGVTIYLQQWNGSSWVDLGNPVTNTKYNDRFVVASVERVVEKNNLYRTRSTHTAKIGNATETKYFFSNSYYYQ